VLLLDVIKSKAPLSSLLLAMVGFLMLTGFTAPEQQSIDVVRSNGENPGSLSGQSVAIRMSAMIDEVASGEYSQPIHLVAQFTIEGLDLGRQRDDVYSYSKKKNSSSNSAPASTCMATVETIAKTGNPIIDTRCKLVAFEVCMHKAIGTISQSQDSKRQCEIMRGLGGPNACLQPCIDAATLPIGGSGTVVTKANTYSGLTDFAVACYTKIVNSSNKGISACDRNEALQCLMNGSSIPSVNSAIRQERQSSCAEHYKKSPNEVCVACNKGEMRVDYDPKKVDLDSVK
jgi:hypothetical protein